MFSTLNIIPLLALPLIFYILVVALFAPAGGVDTWLVDPIFTVTMFSGDHWSVSFADIFMGLSLVFLFVEIVKATRTDAMSIINHGLSMLVAVICIILFVTTQGYSNSTFFMLTLMTILDVVAGFTVTIVAAKRDFGAPVGIAGTH